MKSSRCFCLLEFRNPTFSSFHFVIDQKSIIHILHILYILYILYMLYILHVYTIRLTNMFVPDNMCSYLRQHVRTAQRQVRQHVRI